MYKYLWRPLFVMAMANPNKMRAHSIILSGEMMKRLKRKGAEVIPGMLRPIRNSNDVPRMLRELDKVQRRTTRGGSKMRFATT
jgi:hypothetical protein